jgi:hypothetical protein
MAIATSPVHSISGKGLTPRSSEKDTVVMHGASTKST